MSARDKRATTRANITAEIHCIACGMFIRVTPEKQSARICLICHARLLNQRFQRVHNSRNKGGRGTPRAA